MLAQAEDETHPPTPDPSRPKRSRRRADRPLSLLPRDRAAADLAVARAVDDRGPGRARHGHRLPTAAGARAVPAQHRRPDRAVPVGDLRGDVGPPDRVVRRSRAHRRGAGCLAGVPRAGLPRARPLPAAGHRRGARVAGESLPRRPSSTRCTSAGDPLWTSVRTPDVSVVRAEPATVRPASASPTTRELAAASGPGGPARRVRLRTPGASSDRNVAATHEDRDAPAARPTPRRSTSTAASVYPSGRNANDPRMSNADTREIASSGISCCSAVNHSASGNATSAVPSEERGDDQHRHRRAEGERDDHRHAPAASAIRGHAQQVARATGAAPARCRVEACRRTGRP